MVEIEIQDGHVKGVVTQLHGEYGARCVVIATGTNLGGKIFVGDAWYASGPDGMHASNALTDSLRAAGLPLRRFKTGTPARVHRRSIDFDKLERQPGDPEETPAALQLYDHQNGEEPGGLLHRLHQSHHPQDHPGQHPAQPPLWRHDRGGGAPVLPLHRGQGGAVCRQGPAPHLCGALRGEHRRDVPPGCVSSLPEDVQNAFYHSIVGFEHLEIIRPAYAIEYDCVDPTSLEPTLESRHVRGLYGAGQFNGTSGYEEAAAQGLLAGINAARNALGKEQLVLPRQTSYLGTLVDDLVTKGVMDPYRMMTSRSEYRLTLRQDNADTPPDPHRPGIWPGVGRAVGPVPAHQPGAGGRAGPAPRHPRQDRAPAGSHGRRRPDPGPSRGALADELLRRPEISYSLLAGVIGWGEGARYLRVERIETEIKYAGYIARQDRMIRDMARREKTLIPDGFVYDVLTGLTLEAREKLNKIRPRSLGQAGRIPGVSPSDLAQLSIALAAAQKKEASHD